MTLYSAVWLYTMTTSSAVGGSPVIAAHGARVPAVGTPGVAEQAGAQRPSQELRSGGTRESYDNVIVWHTLFKVHSVFSLDRLTRLLILAAHV